MKRFSLILSYLFCVLGFLAVIALCVILPISDMQKIASVENTRQWFVLNCILYKVGPRLKLLWVDKPTLFSNMYCTAVSGVIPGDTMRG